jgi:cytochrome P450
MRPRAALGAVGALLGGRNLLAPLAALHAEQGDVFRIPLPGFRPLVLAGPAAARFVLVEAHAGLRARLEGDPVTRLLRHGLLVEDGDAHGRLRALMTPPLHRTVVEQHIEAFWRCADEVAEGWRPAAAIHVVDEMRRLALLALTRTLFGADIAPELDALWRPVLRTLAYIAPGAWLLWPAVPRPGYRQALRTMDAYLLRMIASARAGAAGGTGLLPPLLQAGLSDDLIRDQLLTMLIAGHDTVTAALSWVLHLLSQHPSIRARARAEVDQVLVGSSPRAEDLGRLAFLDQVIKETLRLYPPIHVSNRIAAHNLEFEGRRIPEGTRVLFSIYLTHRHPRHWPDPERFDPSRFDPAARQPPAAYTYLPFGAGPRFCIGAAMAQVALKVVLARLLQHFEFEPASASVGLRMAATLEPRGLRLRAHQRATR